MSIYSVLVFTREKVSECLITRLAWRVSTRPKRAFETPETAPYMRQVLPKLNAELGVPADPRRLAPPTDPSLPSGAPTPMPTTSASNKKSNVQIPYSRVTRDAEALGHCGHARLCARRCA